MSRTTALRLVALLGILSALVWIARAARPQEDSGRGQEQAVVREHGAGRSSPNRGIDAEPTPAAAELGATFILLRADELTPEAHLNVIGQGFMPNEQVTATLEDPHGRTEARLEAVAAEKGGRINEVSLALPPGLPLGEHVLRVEGTRSRRSARAQFRLRGVPPRVELDAYSVKPEQPFGFSGSGFVPAEEVEVRLAGLGGAPLITVQADRGGNVSGRAQAPLAQPGDYPLYFIGSRSQNPVAVGLNIQGHAPFVILDQYAPMPYYRLGFRGEDFAPGEPVFVFLNRREGEPLARVQADAGGRLNVKGAVEVPAVRGDATLIFVGGRTGAIVEAKFTVLPLSPTLELTHYAGRPGTPLALIGGGWARNETLRVFVGDPARGGRHEVATFTVDATGGFRGAGRFRLPVQLGPGSQPVTVVGAVSQVEVTVYVEVLRLEPSAELSAYEGPAGTVVSFTGRGFAGGERVTIRLKERTGPVLTSATADETGTFERVGSYPVEGTPGPHAVPYVFVGEESGTQATTHFRIEPR